MRSPIKTGTESDYHHGYYILEEMDDKYVTRSKRVVPEKFLEVCHMHLSFLLDLSGDKLEILLSDDSQRKRRLHLTSAAAAVFKKKEKPPVGLFGSPLTDEGACLMLPLINFLSEESNVCKEGLFRKAGNRNRMNILRESLNVHGTAAQLAEYSPHDVAGVLKEFLRELPEPLLTDKHMEAHRQILEMGKHATTAELRTLYSERKVTALQILFQLVPHATRLIILKMLTLLSKVAGHAETKMTPTTLGTIFAPIFFLSRKVDAVEMCAAVSQTEPALAFMIEHAGILHKAPAKVVVDLTNYWKEQEGGTPLQAISSNQTLKKSTSRQTINTNVCYTDREASRNDDVAGNTQAELNLLYAQVHQLPDTPHFRKIKENVLKGATTPTLPTPNAKKHHRSRSIGASIKKRLPSLSRSKNKRDMSTYSARSKTSVSSNESTTPATAIVDLLESPSVITNARQSRLRHKRHLPVETSDDSAAGECTSPKQEFKPAERGVTPALASPSSSSTSSDCCSPVSPKDTFIAPTPVPDPATCSFHEMTPSEDESSRDSFITSHVPNENTLSNNTVNKASSDRVLKDSNVDKQRLAPLDVTAATPNSKLYQMKEIDYISKADATERLIQRWMGDENKPAVRGQLRPCNAPGTPVMPRSMLRLSTFDALETSI